MAAKQGAPKVLIAAIIFGLCMTSAAIVVIVTNSSDQHSTKQAERTGAKSVKKLPKSWDDQGNEDFIYRSPFKARMRQLWMNANTIASAGSGEAIPAYEEIAVSAKGIARKSSDMMRFWQGVLDAIDEGFTAQKDENWIGLAQSHTDIWKSCNHCHREMWSLAYSHLDRNILKRWKEGRHSRLLANEIDAEPLPEVPNRKVMQRLSAATELLSKGIQERNSGIAGQGLSKLSGVAKTRIVMWSSIHERAQEIEELADQRQIEGMADAYRRMTATCIGCHAANVAEERPILKPLEWK